MAFSTCLFCKRSLNDFCYSIYDECNQPVLNILQLFEDVETHLRNDRYICYECLYIIRWIYFMKKVLKEALLKDDIGENDRVIAAFNLFKLKINQPIFLLDEDNPEGENENHVEEADENEVSHSNIEYVGSGSDSEIEMRGPLDLTRKFFESSGRKGHLRRGHSSSNRVEFENPMGLQRDCDCYESYPGMNNCVQRDETRQRSCFNGNVNSMDCNNYLLEYTCNITACEHYCNTFEELRKHQEEAHLVELSGFTLENYEKQLRELCKSKQIDASQRKRKFRCFLSNCRRVFKSLDTLVDHKMVEHNLLAKFWCSECDNKPFTSQVDLNQHIFNYHNTDMKCIYCSISFSTMQDYLSHLEEHGISKQMYGPNSVHQIYSCQYCDEHFQNMNLLNEHTQNQHLPQDLNRIPVELVRSNESPTLIVRKCVSNKGIIGYDSGEHNRGLCSFKVRLQKDKAVKKPETHLKWMSVKYPQQFLNIKLNNNRKEIPQKKVCDKVEISLPPRKRRLYHVVPDEEPIKTVNVVNNVSVQSVSIVNNTVQKHEQQIVDENVSTEKLQSTSEVNSNGIKTQETLAGNPSEILINNVETPKECKVQNLQGNISDKLIATPIVCENTKPETILNENITKPVNYLTEAIVRSENIISTPDNVPDTNIVEETKSPIAKARVALARKRKRTKRAHLFSQKKRNRKSNLKIAKCGLAPTTQSPDEKFKFEPKPLILSPQKIVTTDPVISNIEDKDMNPGRITMKISLKAIEQYKHSKEGKSERKRKKKLKDRKKNKKMDNLESSKSSLLCDASFSEEYTVCFHKKEDINTPQQEVLITSEINDFIEEQEIVEENMEWTHGLTHAKSMGNASEVQGNRNNIFLNKDEINMIILGESPASTLSPKTSYNDNNSVTDNNCTLTSDKTQTSDIDSASDMDIIDDTLNTEITVYNGHNFTSMSMETEEEQKASHLRSSRGRFIKKTHTLDMKSLKSRKGKVQKKVRSSKQLIVEPPPLVLNTVGNVFLNDHVYAKSAFSS